MSEFSREFSVSTNAGCPIEYVELDVKLEFPVRSQLENFDNGSNQDNALLMQVR